MGLFDLRKDIAKIKENIGKPFDGISSGIKALDNFILGFGKGQMITIGARPSLGKSSLARDILLNTGHPDNDNGVSILCTMEMGCEEVTEMLATNAANVNYDSIKKGYANPSSIDKFKQTVDDLANYDIIINDNSYTTPDSIREMLSAIQEVEPLGCLVIDYLQLMSLRAKFNSRQEEVEQISRELKAIAREYKIPVIAFSQLNRNYENRENARPKMTDLRESGAMEQDSDKIILLYRHSYYDKLLDPNVEDDGEGELIVCKCRGGQTGTVECAFIPEWMSWRDKPDSDIF